MIFETPQSELFRFKFQRLSSKILKFPEFNLAIGLIPSILVSSYDGESWESTSPPQYSYDEDAANMALYNGKPVMIGAYEDIEIHDFENLTNWRSNASYFETFDPVSDPDRLSLKNGPI